MICLAGGRILRCLSVAHSVIPKEFEVVASRRVLTPLNSARINLDLIFYFANVYENIC